MTNPTAARRLALVAGALPTVGLALTAPAAGQDHDFGRPTDSGAQLDDPGGWYEPPGGWEDQEYYSDDGYYDPYFEDDGYSEGEGVYDDEGDEDGFTDVDEQPWYADFYYDAEYRWENEYYREYDLYRDYYGSPRARNVDEARGGDVGRGPIRLPEDAPQRTLQGTVESFLSVERAALNERRTLVKLRLEDGTTRMVDLGPRLDTEAIGLSSGDRIRIRGRRGSLDGRPVLAATRVRVGSVVYDGLQPELQGRRIRGTVARFEEAGLEGFERRHALVRIELQDGRTLLADLGPDAQLSDLQVGPGDRVTLNGQWARFDGRRVFLADGFRVEGETFLGATPRLRR